MGIVSHMMLNTEVPSEYYVQHHVKDLVHSLFGQTSSSMQKVLKADLCVVLPFLIPLLLIPAISKA